MKVGMLSNHTKMASLKLSSSLGLIVASKEQNAKEGFVKKRGRPAGSANKSPFIKEYRSLKANLKRTISNSGFVDKKRPKPQSKASVRLKSIENDTNEILDRKNNNSTTDFDQEDISPHAVNVEDNSNEDIVLSQIVLGNETSVCDIKKEREIKDNNNLKSMKDQEISVVKTIDSVVNAICIPKKNEQSEKRKKTKTFECSTCNKQFPTRYFWHKHNLMAHEDQLYECRVCSFNSTSPEKLKLHIIRMHVDKKEKVESQVPSGSQQGKLQEMMSKQIPRSVVMEDGVTLGKNVLNQIRYVCDLCNRVYVSKFSLERHVRCHTLEKPFACKVCDFQSSYREHMTRHMTTVHLIVHSNEPKLKYNQNIKNVKNIEKNKAQNDDQSEKDVLNKGDVRAKQKRRGIFRKRFECAVCGLKSTHKTVLSAHIQANHPNAHIESLENNDGSKVHLIVTVPPQKKDRKRLTIKCTFCSLIFHDQWKFKIHMRSHTGVKPFECSLCHVKSTTKMTLRDHIHRKHPGDKNVKILLSSVSLDGQIRQVILDVPHREFRCTECQELFNDNYTLKKHTREKHPQSFPFLCVVCNFRAPTKAPMLIHFKECHPDHSLENYITHNGKIITPRALKLPSCDICGMFFAYHSQLVNHKMVHLGEKKFSCDNCQYKTNNKLYLERHVEKKHLGLTIPPMPVKKGVNKRNANKMKQVLRGNMKNNKGASTSIFRKGSSIPQGGIFPSEKSTDQIVEEDDEDIQ